MDVDIYTTVFDSAPCGLLAVDRATGTIVRANRRAVALLGVDEQEVSVADIRALFAEKDRDSIEALLHPGEELRSPIVATPIDGAGGEIAVSASSSHAGLGIVVLALLPMADVAMCAPLSAYASRRSTLSALANAARDMRRPWLMFVDVDRFRSVVAQVGHAEAETVLDGIGARLTGMLTTGDVLTRFGADEFVMLLDATGGAQEAEAAAGRVVRVVMSEPYTVGRQRVHATVSVGLAAIEDASAGVEESLTRAETAARAAKAAGRARYRVFDPALAEQAEQIADISEGLRRALARDELVLHYQPVIDVRRRAVAGAEALLRWDRPGHGLVMPMTFIPIAEQTGLISDIGAWVIHEAGRQVRDWAGQGVDDVWVSVNVSARQLRSGEVVEHLRDAVADTGLHPDKYVLEVTESAIVEDPETAVEVLRTLREMGARIALDDFGTGYSSLGRMRDMPFTELKIDRSFLRYIDARAQDAALVAAMVALAHGFESLAIAEGVETPEQLRYLRVLKCDMVQGFAFSRAVPPDAFKQFVSAGPSWLTL